MLLYGIPLTEIGLAEFAERTAEPVRVANFGAAGEQDTLSLDMNDDGVISAEDARYFCQSMNDPEFRSLVLIGDANLSGSVGFDDFLIMSANFGQSGKHFGSGDFDCSGYISFADFLLMSRNFGKTMEYALPAEVISNPPEVVEETNVCEQPNVECVWPGQERYFQQVMATPSVDAKVFYVQPGVELDRLDIIGRHGDEIHFLPGSQVEGSVKSMDYWESDRGVVNIEASADLLITGLHATNTYRYQIENGDGDEQSSTALDVSWSDNITLRDSVLRGSGKLTVWIQGNSTVDLTNTEIDCYYFCIGVVASDVTSKNLMVNQNNEMVPGDLHAVFWLSSTMRRTSDNVFYGSTQLSFTDTTINKQTGEGIFAGNGREDFRSNVELLGTTQINTSGRVATRADGWLVKHKNYFGISLFLDGDYPTTRADLATDAVIGEMGRFIIHGYGDGSEAPPEAPLIVCDDTGCVSSLDVPG